MNEYKGRLEDPEGNILYPHTKAFVTFMSDGENVEVAFSNHLDEKASLIKFGHTQLNSSINSTDESTSATPKAVKQVNDNLSNHVNNESMHLLRNGGFISGASVDFNNLDFNRLYQVGVADGNGAPPLGYGILLAFRPFSTDYGVQMFFVVQSNAMYIRTYSNNNGWTSWELK